MAVTIIDDGSTIKLTINSRVSSIQKNGLRLKVVDNYLFLYDISNTSYRIAFADVTTPVTANIEELRIAVEAMIDTGSVALPAGASTEAKQDDIIDLLTRQGTLTDGSGSIAVASTSQQIFAANASRKYLLIQNISDTEMWIDFGIDAVEAQPSLLLIANGGSFVAESQFIPTEAVNIICASNTKEFVAKEG